jgi:alginate O-acetyltransferase complex protein AlgI
VLGILAVGLAIDYVIAKAIDRDASEPRRRAWLTLSIGINVLSLLYFKYSNFFVAQLNGVLKSASAPTIHWAEVALPIGVSFFTFHKISYVVDVYRRTSPPTKDFVTFALYVLFFPQLIAGPIIRYHDVAEALASRRHEIEQIAYGAFRFCVGLGKKVLLANQLAVTADLVFAHSPEHLTRVNAWVGVLCYALQIYFDFSGYSDMALGLGHMAGIRFRENFDCPYASLSVTEFWRRWHISLSSWMKEYLYIPLGGNRRGSVRTYANLWVVFLISGLWHGANWTFVVWGAYHGSFLVLEKLFALRLMERWPKILRAAYTFTAVLVGWVFFRAASLGHAFHVLGRLSGLAAFHRDKTTLLLGEVLSNRGKVALVLALVLAFAPLHPAVARLSARYEAPTTNTWSTGLRYAGALACLALASLSLANSTYNPFIYFRF